MSPITLKNHYGCRSEVLKNRIPFRTTVNAPVPDHVPSFKNSTTFKYQIFQGKIGYVQAENQKIRQEQVWKEKCKDLVDTVVSFFQYEQGTEA